MQKWGNIPLSVRILYDVSTATTTHRSMFDFIKSRLAVSEGPAAATIAGTPLNLSKKMFAPAAADTVPMLRVIFEHQVFSNLASVAMFTSFVDINDFIIERTFS